MTRDKPLDKDRSPPLPSLQGDERILRNYELLNELGILTYIDHLSAENRDLETILEQAAKLTTLQSTEEVIDFLSQKLLDKIAPQYLVFVYLEHPSSPNPRILVYRNMKRTSTQFTLPAFEPYKHFFSLAPQSMDFNVFEYMMDRPQFSEPLKVFNPQRIIPLLGFGRPLGFVVVGKKVLGQPLDDKEIRYLDRLIGFASIAFQNALHYQQAIQDFKTRLFNHSYFIQRLDEEIARVKRYQAQLSLLMIDVDFFKRFNDQHGHLAGDYILEGVAKIIKQNIRIEDVAARFGGEEFVILLVQCSLNYAWLIAERIRNRIKDTVFPYEGKPLSVTVSIGVAYCSSQKPVPDSATLIQKADKALYSSKERGRNRTTIYDDRRTELPPGVPDHHVYGEGDRD